MLFPFKPLKVQLLAGDLRAAQTGDSFSCFLSFFSAHGALDTICGFTGRRSFGRRAGNSVRVPEATERGLQEGCLPFKEIKRSWTLGTPIKRCRLHEGCFAFKRSWTLGTPTIQRCHEEPLLQGLGRKAFPLDHRWCPKRGPGPTQGGFTVRTHPFDWKTHCCPGFEFGALKRGRGHGVMKALNMLLSPDEQPCFKQANHTQMRGHPFFTSCNV